MYGKAYPQWLPCTGVFRAYLNLEGILMRKRIINSIPQKNVDSDHECLDIEKLALVEVTSENNEFPIESALLLGKVSGWRASEPGEQIIRLLFDNPQTLQWINLNFEELEIERTQEYVLRWSPDGGQTYQEIIRQQWNFSPDGASCEVEEYQVKLSAVTILELIINPDISGKTAFASLKALRIS